MKAGRFLATGIACGLLVSLVACGGKAPRGVLIITIDTCRADRLGCYGATGVRTPVIDALAERGTRFEQVSAPAPLTLPSHCTIMTGLYPDRHTVRDNGAGRLPESAYTLAERLADAGWRTAAFVSAFPLARQYGLDQGFERFDDEFGESSAGQVLNERVRDVATRLFYDERRAEDAAAEAIPWLREASRGSDPFFAWVHFFDPHAMYRAPARFAQAHGPDSYEAEIEYVDEQIGKLLEAVSGLEDRVIVLVTADHGESLGQHEEKTHGLFVYQSSIRVPWVMAGPGVPAGVQVPDPVSLADVTPTLLDLVGHPADETLDGASVLPILGGESEAEPIVHTECLFPRIHYDWAALRAVRRGQWKLIDAPTRELYDLASDPDEAVNLAEAFPDLVADLAAEIDVHAARGGKLTPDDLEIDPEALERLERLGYVGSVGPDESAIAADLWNQDGRDPKEMVGFFNQLQELPTLMMENRYDDADRLLDELYAADPGNMNVMLKKGLLRRLEENWPEAADWCRRILAVDPSNIDARNNLAFSLMRNGEREAAREQYCEVVARKPEHPSAWEYLATLYSEDGLHDEARVAFERAVAVKPEEAAVHAGYGAALERMGQPTEALARFDRALALDSTLSAAVNGKALVLSHTGRPREAVTILRAGLPALDEDLDTLNNLAWILTNASIDPAEGWEFAKRARSVEFEDAVVMDTFGWAAIRSGNAGEGVEPLRVAWRQTADPEVRAHLGVALAESGQREEGIAHVRAAVAERASLAEIPEVARWNRP